MQSNYAKESSSPSGQAPAARLGSRGGSRLVAWAQTPSPRPTRALIGAKPRPSGPGVDVCTAFTTASPGKGWSESKGPGGAPRTAGKSANQMRWRCLTAQPAQRAGPGLLWGQREGRSLGGRGPGAGPGRGRGRREGAQGFGLGLRAMAAHAPLCGTLRWKPHCLSFHGEQRPTRAPDPEGNAALWPLRFCGARCVPPTDLPSRLSSGRDQRLRTGPRGQ